MSFEEYWKGVKKRIDESLIEVAETLHFSRYIKYTLRGGKRFRGTLTILTAQALGGSIEKALPFSVAVELVHQGVLIHDDFLDSHEKRRGLIPLYRLLDPRRAFLMADMILSAAQSKLVESRDGYKALAIAIYEATRGACLEPLNPLRFLRDVRRRSITKSFYIHLTRLKTAELFGVAPKLGAIASNADPQFIECAYRYGIEVGIAYQMADDLMDYSLARRQEKIDFTTALGLLPSILYFSPEILPRFSTSLARRRLSHLPSILAEVDIHDKCMSEIQERIRSAKEKIEPFPEGRYKKLLLEAPDYFVSKMLEAMREV